MPPPMAKTTYI